MLCRSRCCRSFPNPNPNPDPNPDPYPNPNPNQVPPEFEFEAEEAEEPALAERLREEQEDLRLCAQEVILLSGQLKRPEAVPGLVTVGEHGQSATTLAEPQLGSCASSGRALAALGGSAFLERGRPTERPATASAARASRLQVADSLTLTLTRSESTRPCSWGRTTWCARCMQPWWRGTAARSSCTTLTLALALPLALTTDPNY